MKLKKIKTFVCISLLIFSIGTKAQKVEKAKLKYGGYGQKKFNDSNKKVFIEQFNINYQYIYAKTKSKKGGRQIGGGYLGDAKAALFLGLGNINPEELQKITDNLYTEFTTKLKEKGFTILTGDSYKNHSYYSNTDIYKGGTPKEFFQGFISTAPTGVPFINKNYGAFNTTLKTSKQLDGVIVARVNIMIPFAENGESQGSRALGKMFGGIAKVVAKPNLRVGTSIIQTKSKLGFDKFNTVTSNIDFGFKTGLKYQAWFTSNPKKEIEIQGVLPNKKYKAVTTANQDLNGTQAGNYRIFSVPNAELEKMQTIDVDITKYYKGVKEALTYFLDSSTNKFLTYIK